MYTHWYNTAINSILKYVPWFEMMESINPKSLDFIKMLAPHFRWSCRAPLKTCFLDASPHYCTSATIIHCILDKALLSILCLSSMSLFVIYHHFLCNSGDHRRPVREEREKAKRKREGERWQWLKSRKVSRDLFLPAPKKKKKKAHVGVSLSYPLFKCSLEKVCQTRSGAFETCL